MTLRDIKESIDGFADYLAQSIDYSIAVGGGDIHWLDANVFALLIVAAFYLFMFGIVFNVGLKLLEPSTYAALGRYLLKVFAVGVKLLEPSTYAALGLYLLKGPKNMMIFFTFDPGKHVIGNYEDRWDYFGEFLLWLSIVLWISAFLILPAIFIYGK